MGRKFCGVLGSFPGFCSATIISLSISDGKEEAAAWLYISASCGASISLNDLKYSPEKPYGPGDLLLGNESIVWEISCVINGEFYNFFCTSESWSLIN